jgi:hypothetical protein
VKAVSSRGKPPISFDVDMPRHPKRLGSGENKHLGLEAITRKYFSAQILLSPSYSLSIHLILQSLSNRSSSCLQVRKPENFWNASEADISKQHKNDLDRSPATSPALRAAFLLRKATVDVLPSFRRAQMM